MEWTIKTTGAASSVTQDLGSSTNELYLIGGEPAAAPCATVAEAESVKYPEGGEAEGEEEEPAFSPCTPIFFSALEMSTTGIEQPNPTEAQRMAGVWAGFSNSQPLPVKLRQNNPSIPVPLINRPRWSRATGNFGPPIIFKYYSPVPVGQTVAALGPWAEGGWRVLGGCTSLDEMLAEGNGRCGTFAQWLTDQFAIQNVSAHVVHLDVSFGPAPPGGRLPCNSSELEVCVMLVKNWTFHGAGTSGDALFPFRATEVTDGLGIAGQGVENPPPFFWDHAIVRAGREAPPAGPPGGAPRALFDPSYGSGPIAGATSHARLQNYQNAAIEGLCRPTRLVNDPVGTTLAQAQIQLPMKCVRPGPGLQLEAIP